MLGSQKVPVVGIQKQVRFNQGSRGVDLGRSRPSQSAAFFYDLCLSGILSASFSHFCKKEKRKTAEESLAEAECQEPNS